MKDYLIVGAVLVGGWLLISRPLTKREIRARGGPNIAQKLMGWAIAGGCVWFAWWVLSTRCGGSC